MGEDVEVQEPAVQTPPPVPPQQPPSQKLWQSLNSSGYYTKSYDEFNKQFSTPDKINKLYGSLNQAGYYTKGADDFNKQFFAPTPKGTQGQPYSISNFDPNSPGAPDTRHNTQQDAQLNTSYQQAQSKPQQISPGIAPKPIQKNSWSNIGDFSFKTVQAGLEKDLGGAMKFVGDNFAFSDKNPLSRAGENLRQAGEHDEQGAQLYSLPNTTMGNVASSAIGFAPDILELALTPELDVAKIGKLGDVLAKYGGKYAPKVVNMAIGKFPVQQAAKGLTGAYADNKAAGMGDSDAMADALKTGAADYGKGVLFEGAGKAAEKATDFGKKLLEDNGLMSDNKLVAGAEKKILHSTAQATAFSAVPFVDNAIQGKPTSLDELKNNAIFGGVLGMIHGGEVKPDEPTPSDGAAKEVLQRAPLVDLHNFMDTDVNTIKAINDTKETPHDLQIKAATHAEDAFKSDDQEEKQQQVVQSSLNGKASSVKAVTQSILKDKDGVINAVNDLPLPAETKVAVIAKVDEVHKALDPVEQQKTKLADEITQLQQEPTGDIIKDKENKIKLQDKNAQLDDIIKKQYEQTKPNTEIPAEQPADETVGVPKVADQNDETTENSPIKSTENEKSTNAKETGNGEEAVNATDAKSGAKPGEKNLATEKEVEKSGAEKPAPETTENKKPNKDAYEKEIDNLDDTKKFTDIKDLEVGDHVAIPQSSKSSGLTGFIRKISPKNVDIETQYGGWAGNDSEPMTIKKPKSEISEFYKPKKGEPDNAVQEQSTGKVDVQPKAENGERVGTGNAKSENTTEPGKEKGAENKKEVKSALSDKSKVIADKIRSLKVKSEINEATLGIPIAIYNGAIETAATIIEQGGRLADAIQAAVNHIKANSDEKDEDKIRKAITADLSAAGLEDRYEEPEMVEANNAYMDAKIEGKFGADALDSIIDKLQDTKLENIVNGVKEKMKGDPDYLAKVRKRVLEDQGGSEEDQAALLMDQYTLKGRESAVIDEINQLTDKKAIAEKQKQLSDIQDDILDNAMANRQIGRQASSIFRLRQVAVDQSANLHDMREKFLATEGLKKLTPEQEEFIRQQYQGIRDAEEKVAKIKEEEKKAREENQRLKTENEALKKIIDDAKSKHAKTKQTTTERLTTIRKSIDNSKKELGKIFSANAFLNPEVYKHLKNIAIGKAEEILVKTKESVKLNALVKSVMDEIKDVAPHITEDDVRDAISGRNTVGKTKTRSELQKNLAELKTQASLISRINDVENNIELQIKKHGESSPEVKGLQKQLAELKRAQKLVSDFEAMEKETLDTSTKPRTNNTLPPKEEERQKNIQRYKFVKRKTAEIEDDLKHGRFTTVAKQAKELEKSPALKEAEHKLAGRKFQWEKGRKQALMKNAPWYKKLSNNILQWQHFSVLSYPATMAKLALVALKGVVFKPFQLAFQEANYRIMHMVGKITGKGDASGMIYGKVRGRAVAKFYSEFVRNFSIQNIKNAFSGMDEADLLYGSSKYMEDYDMGSGFHNSFLEFPGRSHGYIKSFLRNPETAFAHEQLLQGYIEKSAQIEKKLANNDLSDGDRKELEKQQRLYDPSNDETLERINSLATEHGKWAILMNKNHLVEASRTFFNSIGLPGFVLKTEFPILKLPMNYAARFYLAKYGLVQALTGMRDFSQFKEGKFELKHPGLIHIALKGTDGLTDLHKELLSRSLTYGSQGAAAFAAGYMLYKSGIIQKNDDGSVDVGGQTIPKIALDSPIDDSFLSGATLGQHMDASNGDDWIKNFVESDIDVVKKMPFTSQLKYGFMANAVQALYAKKQETTDKIMQKAIDRKIQDMVTPGFIKAWAKAQQDGLQPQPDGLKETIESGFPYLWNDVDKVTYKP